MNRSFSLNPASLVVGIILCAVCFLSMSQAGPLGQHPIAQHVVVGYGPEPRDMLHIQEGINYTVPPGKIFVLTGVGAAFPMQGGTVLSVDGQPEVEGGLLWSGNNGMAIAEGSSVAKCPIGFTVAAGSTISLAGGGYGRAWGYLTPQ